MSLQPTNSCRSVVAALAVALFAVLGLASYGGATAQAQEQSEAPSQELAAGPVLDDEAAFVASLNEVRAANGLPALVIDNSMTVAARDWTTWMVDNLTLQHADDIVVGAPTDWLKVGENVGRGGSVDSIFQAFMESPGHAANVLDESYTRVGVGVFHAPDGRIYTTHRFAVAAVDVGEPAPAPEPEPEAPVAPADDLSNPPSDLVLAFVDDPAEPAPDADARLTHVMTVLLAAA